MTALPVQAQIYPTKPIVVVVPSAAGGPADVAIRAIAEPLSQALGQQIVVDNMAGAGGTLGMARVARAEPDGHTLLIHQNGFAIAPALYRSLPFDTEKDFIAVGLVNRSHLIWAGRRTLPADTFAEMVAWMKGPGKPAKVAHPGVGTLGHLQTTMLINGIGVEVSMVPYRGIAPAVKDLLGDHVDMAQIGAAVASAQVRSGNLKIFAVGAEQRDPLFPDVPTYVELGYKGMDKPFWHALFAPAKTPRPVLERINAALRHGARRSECARKLQEDLCAGVSQRAAVAGCGAEIRERRNRVLGQGRSRQRYQGGLMVRYAEHAASIDLIELASSNLRCSSQAFRASGTSGRSP